MKVKAMLFVVVNIRDRTIETSTSIMLDIDKDSMSRKHFN